MSFSSKDFRLTSDTKDAVSGYASTDYIGAARPQGAGADRGAYEHSSGSPGDDAYMISPREEPLIGGNARDIRSTYQSEP